MRDFCYVERGLRADNFSSNQNPCAGSNIGLDMKRKEKMKDLLYYILLGSNIELDMKSKEKKRSFISYFFQNAIWICCYNTNIFIRS